MFIHTDDGGKILPDNATVNDMVAAGILREDAEMILSFIHKRTPEKFPPRE